MQNKPTNRERLQEITAGIEQGIKELFESEKYMRYLSVMSKFHRYSVNNTMLIYMQRPDATLVAGFNKWKNQFERHVKKGEHGITIIAPTPYKKKIEEMKRDPDTQAPILDANGKAVMEEKKIEIPLFRPVKVFDVSQTDGKPLPELASSLSGTVPHYEAFLEALRRSAPVPIEFEPMAANTDGYFSPDQQRIAIREGMCWKSSGRNGYSSFLPTPSSTRTMTGVSLRTIKPGQKPFPCRRTATLPATVPIWLWMGSTPV